MRPWLGEDARGPRVVVSENVPSLHEARISVVNNELLGGGASMSYNMRLAFLLSMGLVNGEGEVLCGVAADFLAVWTEQPDLSDPIALCLAATTFAWDEVTPAEEQDARSALVQAGVGLSPLLGEAIYRRGVPAWASGCHLPASRCTA